MRRCCFAEGGNGHLPDFTGLRMLVGGEALGAELARDLEARGRSLTNLYGPTETTIWSAAMAIEGNELAAPQAGDMRADGAAAALPIGRPIWNTRLYVLDGGLAACPAGVVGELYIAGVGLARGYLGRSGLTAERFVADPYGSLHGACGSRMYRTGDLARWRADVRTARCWRFAGRADARVKLRGFRIELGEIESVLTAHEQDCVSQAVVVARSDGGSAARLIGYVVPVSGRGGAKPCGAGSRAALRGAIAVSCPRYIWCPRQLRGARRLSR